LKTAGTNANFDQIQNSGRNSIPANNLYIRQLKLIVRVMAYGWGKSEHMLGELVLNAVTLAESERQQTLHSPVMVMLNKARSH
jgi:hypothetical protein